MKKIGIIGGLTFAASLESYRKIAEISNRYLHGYHTATILIISIDPTEIISAIHTGNWKRVADNLVKVALDLERLGAECVLIPCNSVHKIADEIQKRISVPLINMIDCVGTHINESNCSNVGLLGTLFTMEDGFYQDHLRRYFQIETVVPHKKDREILHRIIFNELCHGRFQNEAKESVKEICTRLHEQTGCETIILGCTELPLLLKQNDIDLPLINTIDVQAEYVVKFAKNNVTELYLNASGM